MLYTLHAFVTSDFPAGKTLERLALWQSTRLPVKEGGAGIYSRSRKGCILSSTAGLTDLYITSQKESRAHSAQFQLARVQCQVVWTLHFIVLLLGRN